MRGAVLPMPMETEMTETLSKKLERLRGEMRKEAAMRLAGDARVADRKRLEIRAAAFEAVAEAQELRDAFAHLAATAATPPRAEEAA